MKKLIIILFIILFLYSCRDNGKYKVSCLETYHYAYCESYKIDNKIIYMYDINNNLIGVCLPDWYIEKLKE